MLARQSMGTYPENKLTHNLSRNFQPQSSQLAEPLWTDPGLTSGIGVRELISTLKKETQAGIESTKPSSKILASKEKVIIRL